MFKQFGKLGIAFHAENLILKSMVKNVAMYAAAKDDRQKLLPQKTVRAPLQKTYVRFGQIY